MAQKHSASEIRAAAEAALTAKNAADAAKAALDADPENETLKEAYEAAKADASAKAATADALSQDPVGAPSPEQIQKMKRRRAILSDQLRAAGALDDDEPDDEDEEDLDKPMTRREFQQMEVARASQTSVQMADAIEDAMAKQAVKDALKSIVPSGNPGEDFRKAVAVANADKNSKVLEEISRRGTPARFGSGAGAPAPAPGDVFRPTDEEKRMMDNFGLTEKDILAARAQSAPQA